MHQDKDIPSSPPFEQAGKIAVATLTSRVLGMVRDLLIVAALGAGADIFFMAFRIPNIMRRMAGEGVLGMSHAASLNTFNSSESSGSPGLSVSRTFPATPIDPDSSVPLASYVCPDPPASSGSAGSPDTPVFPGSSFAAANMAEHPNSSGQYSSSHSETPEKQPEEFQAGYSQSGALQVDQFQASPQPDQPQPDQRKSDSPQSDREYDQYGEQAVPVYPQAASAGSFAFAYSLKMAWVYGIAGLLAALTLALLAPQCIMLIAPGFEEQQLIETARLFRQCLPYLPLAAVSAILSVTLVNFERAGYAAFAPVFLNLGIIALGMGSFTTGSASYFTWGVVLGGTLQVIWLGYWFLARYREITPGKTLDKPSGRYSAGKNVSVTREFCLLARGVLNAVNDKTILPLRQLLRNCLKTIQVFIQTIINGDARRDSQRDHGGNSRQGVQKNMQSDAPSCIMGKTRKDTWKDTRRDARTDDREGVEKGVSFSCGAFHLTLRNFGRTLMVITAGSSAYIYFFTASAAASFFASGSVSALYLSERLVEFPLALIGVSLGMAAIPRFSALAADKKPLRSETERALRFGCFLLLPAAAGFIGLSSPVARLLFEHGAFGSEETAMTASVIRIMGFVLLPLGVSRLLLSLLVVLESSAPAKGSGNCLRGVVHVLWLGCLCILTVSVALAGVMGVNAVAWGLVAAGWLQCGLLWRLAVQRAGITGLGRFLGGLYPVWGGAVIAALLLWGMEEYLMGISSFWIAGTLLLLTVSLTVISWVALYYWCGREEAKTLVQMGAGWWRTLRGL